MHICQSLEELGLQKAWCAPFVKSEKFGSIGSWTTERFFPTAAVEDKENHIFWSAALEHNASWMMELTRDGGTLSFSGGIADMETSVWAATERRAGRRSEKADGGSTGILPEDKKRDSGYHH